MAVSVNTGDWWVGRVGRRVGYREGLAPLDHTSCDGEREACAGWGRTVSWVSAGGHDAVGREGDARVTFAGGRSWGAGRAREWRAVGHGACVLP